MPTLLSDVKVYAAAVTPEDDIVTNIGGGPDTSKKHDFADINGSWQVLSSNAGDTTQTITVTYRDLAGETFTEVLTLNGQTPVLGAASIDRDKDERILKAVKSATTLGDIAVESQTAVRTGTAQGAGPGVDTIQLDAGAASVTGFYVPKVIRITSGAGIGQIAEILKYDGITKIATVSRAWAVAVNATSVFRISDGLYFDKTPNEILSIVRLYFGSTPGPAGSGDRKYYSKIFFVHTDPSGALENLTSAEVQESSDPTEAFGSDVKFALDATVNGTSTNGVGNNRRVAPAGFTFDDLDKAVPGGQLTPGQRIGCWLELTLPEVGASLRTSYVPRFFSQIGP